MELPVRLTLLTLAIVAMAVPGKSYCSSDLFNQLPNYDKLYRNHMYSSYSPVNGWTHISPCEDIVLTSSCNGFHICLQNGTDYIGIPLPTNVTNKYDDRFLTHTLTFDWGTCENNDETNKTFAISFICGPNEGLPDVIKSDPCALHYVWITSAACSTKTSGPRCIVEMSEGGTYSLEALSYPFYTKVYVPEALHRVNHYVSPCLGAVSYKRCSSNSPGCQFYYKKYSNHKRFGNYSNIVSSSNGTLIYDGGSMCDDASKTKWKIEFKFICNPIIGKGKPVGSLAKFCTFSIEWQTAYVCPAERVLKEYTGNCRYIDDQTQAVTDLSNFLRPDGSPYEVFSPKEGLHYLINLCGASASPRYPQAAVISYDSNGRYISLGRKDKPSFFFVSPESLILTYSNGDYCRMGKYGKEYFKSKIIFTCNPTESFLSTEPVFYKRKYCDIHFTWFTPIMCKSHRSCAVNINGSYFDLDFLRSDHKDFEITEQSGRFYVNICGNLHTNRCPPGTVACFIPYNETGEVIAIGKHWAKSAEYWSLENDIVQVKFTHGHSRCPNKMPATALIHMFCGVGDPEPFYVEHDTETCTYTFYFPSDRLCKKFITFNHSRDLIYEPELEYVSDIGPIFRKSWIVETGKTGTFYISLRDPMGGPCGNETAICQMDTNQALLSIHEVKDELVFYKTAKYTNTALFKLNSSLACPTMPQKNIQFKFQLKCIYNEDDALELVYKSPSCEFNFAWLTMQMCYEKSKEFVNKTTWENFLATGNYSLFNSEPLSPLPSIITTSSPTTVTEPTVTSQKSTTITEPTTTSQKPTTVTEPTTTSQKPTTVTEPTTTSQKPTTVTELTTTSQKPTTVTEPTTTSQKPTTVTEPTTTNDPETPPVTDDHSPLNPERFHQNSLLGKIGWSLSAIMALSLVVVPTVFVVCSRNRRKAFVQKCKIIRNKTNIPTFHYHSDGQLLINETENTHINYD